MTDFSAVREMTPYLSDPPAMAVGTPGKSGYLRLGFELDASTSSCPTCLASISSRRAAPMSTATATSSTSP